MSTTWSSVRDEIYLLLNSDTSNFSESLLIWAWNAAQRHFTHHTPMQKVASLVVKSGSRTAVLPEDFFDMGRLYDPVSQCWWQSMNYQPGGYYNETSDVKAYAIWGNELKLYENVSSSFDLWYYAYWPSVEYTTEDSTVKVEEGKILVPMWSEIALEYLSVAICLAPKAVQSAMVRTWNMRLDSGTPIMNSRSDEAWDLFKWYETLIGMHPPLVRGGHV